jgi:hypothetical protein
VNAEESWKQLREVSKYLGENFSSYFHHPELPRRVGEFSQEVEDLKADYAEIYDTLWISMTKITDDREIPLDPLSEWEEKVKNRETGSEDLLEIWNEHVEKRDSSPE